MKQKTTLQQSKLTTPLSRGRGVGGEATPLSTRKGAGGEALDIDKRFMRLALDEAEEAARLGEIPVGAVVVARGQVIARAHNLTERLTDVTAHAEMQAITAAATALGGKYLTECTLYVTLEPCIMCAGAIGWSQMARLVYGAADEKRGYSRFAPQALHPRTEVCAGVLADESTRLVQQFFKKKRGGT